MLLFKNEAPPGNKARIPPKLMDVFLHYKKDTDTIVGWLLCHGGTARQRYVFLSSGPLIVIVQLKFMAVRMLTLTERKR